MAIPASQNLRIQSPFSSVLPSQASEIPGSAVHERASSAPRNCLLDGLRGKIQNNQKDIPFPKKLKLHITNSQKK